MVSPHRSSLKREGEDLTIVAIDPGKMTGYAIAQLGVVQTDEAPCWSFLADFEDRWLHQADVIVCEDFRYTASSTKKDMGEHWSMKSIGVLEYWSRRHQIELVMQTPADAKRVISASVLKRLGWYWPTVGGHANDAARHMALYCLKNRLVELPE